MPNIAITSIDDLYSIGTDPAFPDNGVYDLTTDLDLGDTVRNPLPNFHGAFYGHGHKITGLNVVGEFPDNGGLFIYIALGFGSPPDAGVYDLEIHGVASSELSTGLLAGTADAGTELHPYKYQNIKCFGAVESLGAVGTSAGGLFGTVAGGGDVPPITGCSFEGIVTSAGENVGGLVGNIEALGMTNCYADADVTGVDRVGGLAGSSSAFAAYIDRCGSRGTVTATSSSNARVGGLVGFLDGDVSDSYSLADVVASNNGQYAGGLAGQKSSAVGKTVARCLATGQVTGAGDHTAGFIGQDLSSDTTYDANFWDTEATGRANAGTNVTATGLTTAEAEQVSTYSDAGWDIVAVPVSSP